MLNDKDILFYLIEDEAYPYARILRNTGGEYIELQRFKTPEDAALRNNPRNYPHYASPDWLCENFQRVAGVSTYPNGPVPEDYRNLTIRASEISNYPGIVFRFPWMVDGEEADPVVHGYVYLTADPRKDTHVFARTREDCGWHCRGKITTDAICYNFIGEQVYSWPEMPKYIHSIVMGDSDVEE